MAGRVLRLEPVPSADDPTRLIQAVVAVSAGRRDVPSLADALGSSEPVAQSYLDAGVWLGLLTPGVEVQLTRRGMGLVAASARRRRRLLAAAMWLTPAAAELVRATGTVWTVERVRAALRAAYPSLSPERADRLASSAYGLLLPAFEHPHVVKAPDVQQLALPFGVAAPPAPEEPRVEPADDADEPLRRALLDQGELGLAGIAAITGGPAGPAVDRLIGAGLAHRVEGGVVAAPALVGVRLRAIEASGGSFLESLDTLGLGVAFPSALAPLAGGLAAANAELRRQRDGALSRGSPFSPSAVVHGGLLTPGERPPRILPDALTLRLRALTISPAFAMLAALLLIDRRAEGRLRIDAGTGLVRWRRKALGSLLDLFTRFSVDQAWIPLRAARPDERLSDDALIEAAVGLGLARRAEGRLMLDEGLFSRLRDDVEAGLALEALAPLAARLQAWVEWAARGGGAPGLAVFVYGTLMSGESNAGMLGAAARQPAKARGRLVVLPQGYPVLIPDAAGQEIAGERVEGLPPEVVLALDDLEGTARGLYRRVSLVVETDRGPAPAAAYVMSAAEAQRHGGRPVDLTAWRARAGAPRA